MISLRRCLYLAIAATCGLVGGCNKGEPSTDEQAAANEPAGKPLPDVRDNSDNLLLTWVDAQGEFHVVQKVSDVPEEGREEVRVVDLKRGGGTPESVYVADLRTARADGSYPVKAMPRNAWDELGAARRKVRLEQLGLKPEASARAEGAGGAASGAGTDGNAAQKNEIVAIIYGADWCKPCHDAEKHLKRAGVLVIKKDIEEDARARQEMQEKLARAHRSGASIPIIDVMGQILVGFSAHALDAAVQAARRSAAREAPTG